MILFSKATLRKSWPGGRPSEDMRVHVELGIINAVEIWTTELDRYIEAQKSHTEQ
jgi:hypothetical protein